MSIIVKEVILHRGQMMPARRRLLFLFKEKGSRLCGLLPDINRWWACVLEDITRSQWWIGVRDELLKECVSHDEFVHTTMDATVRVLRRIVGQADYRASQAAKAAQAVPESESKRRLLSIRGITGAVLTLSLVYDESCENISAEVLRTVPLAIRVLVTSMAFDNPSRALYVALKACLPHLLYLCLDCIHLVILYNQAQWKKKRPGEVYLRKIMRKFVQVDPSKTPGHWGIPFFGEGAAELLPQEQRYRSMISAGSMLPAEARAASTQLDDTKPFYTVMEFLQALASTTALYWAEVDKPTHAKGVRLCDLLWRAGAPHRIQWYLNNTRLMHSLPANMLSLVSNGSTSNESLNHEINAATKNQPTPRHLDSVKSQMEFFQQGKLLSHNSALYQPTTSVMKAADVLAMRVATLEISTSAWEAWCAQHAVRNFHRCFHNFRLVRTRLLILQKMRARGICVRRLAKGHKKRHPFNLMRVKRKRA